MKKWASLAFIVVLIGVGAWAAEAQTPPAQTPPAPPEQPQRTISYRRDIQPMFTENDAWFNGSQACRGCHHENLERAVAELDLSSYEGLVRGSRSVSNPPGRKVLEPGKWNQSFIRARLSNNRMPPGWVVRLDFANLNGPCVKAAGDGFEIDRRPDGMYVYGGCETNRLGLLGAWVDAGAPETQPFAYGGQSDLTYEKDVAPLFHDQGAWFEGSPPCVQCHFATTAPSIARLNLVSYAGIVSRTEPIVTPGNWNASGLRFRLTANRMPPGASIDTPRGGPWVTHPVTGKTVRKIEVLADWVAAGMPDN